MFKKIYNLIKEIVFWCSFFFAPVVIVAISAIGTIILAALKSLKKTYSVEMPLYAVLIICVISITSVLFLIIHYAQKFFSRKRPLKETEDIKNAINTWFNQNGCYMFRLETGQQYYFDEFDEQLNIKKGSAKKLLPILAYQNKYTLTSGNETFMLNYITNLYEYKAIFERTLKDTHKEIDEHTLEFDCLTFSQHLKWPIETARHFAMECHKNCRIEFHKNTAIITKN